jgi:hypothetical protein
MKWDNLHSIFKSEHKSVGTPTMAMAQLLQSSSIHLLRGFWRSFLVLVDLPPPHASREKRPASCARPPAKWTTVLGVGCRWQLKSLSETKTTAVLKRRDSPHRWSHRPAANSGCTQRRRRGGPGKRQWREPCVADVWVVTCSAGGRADQRRFSGGGAT